MSRNSAGIPVRGTFVAGATSYGARGGSKRGRALHAATNVTLVPGRGHAPGGSLVRMFDLGFDGNLCKLSHQEICEVIDVRERDRQADAARREAIADEKRTRELIAGALRLLNAGYSLDDLRDNTLFASVVEAIAATR